MLKRSTEYYQSLLREFIKLPTEVEWIEFKVNNKDPERIAKYISGMSNVATILGQPFAYLVWGINNESHIIEGTNFRYRESKKGNEELEAWLMRMINPKIDFNFREIPIIKEDNSEGVVTLIEIPCAENTPTRYGSVGYIRIGSNLKSLADYPEKEAELWRCLNNVSFEKRIAYTEANDEAVVQLLDYPAYYRILNLPIPANREKVLRDFSDEKFIKRNAAGNWDITNYGALMIATDLKAFETLERKTVRVIRYRDKRKINGLSEIVFSKGYAVGFEEIIQYIMTVTPQSEIVEEGIRRQFFDFPESAIRELVANIEIHQALEQKGTHPMIEIFSDRMEFSNAGAPLVAIERIVDTVPISRNEKMAGFMHRCGICEERGSGYDKIIAATSQNSLLAPRIENQNNQFTKVTLFAKVPFNLTSKEDRIRTCYMQACYSYVNYESISNADIRSIFSLDEKEKYKVSRIIKDTLEAKLIKPVDPDTAPRYMRYIPFWA